MPTNARALSIALAAAALIAVVAPRDTAACGNEVDLMLTPTVLVGDAEKLVNEGKLQAAHDRIALLPVPDFRYGIQPFLDRAMVVAARAVIRSDGELAMPRRPDGKREPKREGASGGRTENLTEAVALLKTAAAAHKDDPSAQTDLAEGLARLPDERVAAKSMLALLESKAVMASAWGYASLAQLRGQAGQGQPAWLAASLGAVEQAPRAFDIARCEKMAVRKEICSGQKLEDAMKKVPLSMPAARVVGPPPPGSPARGALGADHFPPSAHPLQHALPTPGIHDPIRLDARLHGV